MAPIRGRGGGADQPLRDGSVLGETGVVAVDDGPVEPTELDDDDDGAAAVVAGAVVADRVIAGAAVVVVTAAGSSGETQSAGVTGGGGWPGSPTVPAQPMSDTVTATPDSG